MDQGRRQFGKGVAAAATVAVTTTALGSRRVAGAGERIGVGIIGCGGKGQSVWKNFLAQPEVEARAVCDVYQPFAEKGVALSGGRATVYKDFRKLLDDKTIDAVIIATPDHWHALQTIAACRAGKDVYVEKPMSLSVREGRVMVNEARKHRRVVQVGSQQRSGAHYVNALKLVRDGAIGEVHKISAGFTRNVLPGFKPRDLKVDTSNLDWDMWLGPAPRVAFDPFRCIYNFRWFWDYSGGQMTNFGAHHLDIVRWALRAPGPSAIAGFGGRFAIKDGGETPDVQEVVYQFPGCVVTWTARELNRGRAGGADIEFHGTRGTLALSRSGFKVTPEGTDTGGGDVAPAPGAKAPAAAVEEKGSEMNVAHIRDFLACVKSRARPVADVEEGHLSAAMCHLGNIATRLGRSLRWDPRKEEIAGDSEANRMLSRPYRKPWALPVA
jgi:predicted dehydrogenase